MWINPVLPGKTPDFRSVGPGIFGGMASPTIRALIGAQGEEIAAQHLTAIGYRILERNWRCRYGELDIIAENSDEVVFIEVKARTGSGFGTPAEAVTRTKLRRLRRLAGLWLAAQHRSWSQIRIDVIEVRFRGAHPQINHIPGVS